MATSGITSATRRRQFARRSRLRTLASDVLSFANGTTDTFLGTTVDKSTVLARYNALGRHQSRWRGSISWTSPASPKATTSPTAPRQWSTRRRQLRRQHRLPRPRQTRPELQHRPADFSNPPARPPTSKPTLARALRRRPRTRNQHPGFNCRLRLSGSTAQASRLAPIANEGTLNKPSSATSTSTCRDTQKPAPPPTTAAAGPDPRPKNADARNASHSSSRPPMNMPRGLLHGIRAYIREHELLGQSISTNADAAKPPAGSAAGTVTGVIARHRKRRTSPPMVLNCHPPLRRRQRRTPGPRHPLGQRPTTPRSPRLAFDHLRERGLTHFGFCGDDHFNWSTWRRDVFTKLVHDIGCDCSIFPFSGHAPAAPLRTKTSCSTPSTRLGKNILPKPAGVMACYDIRGDRSSPPAAPPTPPSPTRVAVIGCDNDELLCDLSRPPSLQRRPRHRHHRLPWPRNSTTA